MFNVVTKLKNRSVHHFLSSIGSVIHVSGTIVKSKKENNIISIHDLNVLATYMTIISFHLQKQASHERAVDHWRRECRLSKHILQERAEYQLYKPSKLNLFVSQSLSCVCSIRRFRRF